MPRSNGVRSRQPQPYRVDLQFRDSRRQPAVRAAGGLQRQLKDTRTASINRTPGTESRRSALSHGHHRYPAAPVRSGRVRARGRCHSGSRRRDRPQVRALPTGRSAALSRSRSASAPRLRRIGGCSTCLDAPAGATGFSPRVSFDITRNNLWGITHSISLRTRVSTLEQQALLTYTWPRFAGQRQSELSRSPDCTTTRRMCARFRPGGKKASLQLSQQLTKATTLFYRYSYRRVSIDQATLKITPFLIPLLSQPVRVGELSMSA